LLDQKIFPSPQLRTPMPLGNEWWLSAASHDIDLLTELVNTCRGPHGAPITIPSLHGSATTRRAAAAVIPAVRAECGAWSGLWRERVNVASGDPAIVHSRTFWSVVAAHVQSHEARHYGGGWTLAAVVAAVLREIIVTTRESAWGPADASRRWGGVCKIFQSLVIDAIESINANLVGALPPPDPASASPLDALFSRAAGHNFAANGCCCFRLEQPRDWLLVADAALPPLPWTAGSDDERVAERRSIATAIVQALLGATTQQGLHVDTIHFAYEDQFVASEALMAVPAPRRARVIRGVDLPVPVTTHTSIVLHRLAEARRAAASHSGTDVATSAVSLPAARVLHIAYSVDTTEEARALAIWARKLGVEVVCSQRVLSPVAQGLLAAANIASVERLGIHHAPLVRAVARCEALTVSPLALLGMHAGAADINAVEAAISQAVGVCDIEGILETASPHSSGGFTSPDDQPQHRTTGRAVVRLRLSSLPDMAPPLQTLIVPTVPPLHSARFLEEVRRCARNTAQLLAQPTVVYVECFDRVLVDRLEAAVSDGGVGLHAAGRSMLRALVSGLERALCGQHPACGVDDGDHERCATVRQSGTCCGHLERASLRRDAILAAVDACQMLASVAYIQNIG
jgi:hypothetical protein